LLTVDLAPGTEPAATLRALHERGPLVLPNAWDAASAVAIELAGAEAIATTSAGISWARGRSDGERLDRERMLQALGEIVASVAVPVSADIESGYGATPEAVGLTVRAVINAGIAGINIEDRDATDGSLRASAEQAARIAAARDAANERGVALWINARTDTFLGNFGTVDEQLRETTERAKLYAAAGADSLFVPGVIDLAVIRALASGPLPINVMSGPGAPDVSALIGAGARRVSVGSAIAQAAYGLVTRAARELLTSGRYESLNDAFEYGELNDLFSR
jgi:2-methylisocitrate lyase-like PEP mutase family enzyme